MRRWFLGAVLALVLVVPGVAWAATSVPYVEGSALHVWVSDGSAGQVKIPYGLIPVVVDASGDVVDIYTTGYGTSMYVSIPAGGALWVFPGASPGAVSLDESVFSWEYVGRDGWPLTWWTASELTESGLPLTLYNQVAWGARLYWVAAGSCGWTGEVFGASGESLGSVCDLRQSFGGGYRFVEVPVGGWVTLTKGTGLYYVSYDAGFFQSSPLPLTPVQRVTLSVRQGAAQNLSLLAVTMRDWGSWVGWCAACLVVLMLCIRVCRRWFRV